MVDNFSALIYFTAHHTLYSIALLSHCGDSDEV